MNFGPSVRQILEAGGDTDIALNAEVATVYSQSFKLVAGTAFSIWLKGAGTTVRMDVFLEQSYVLPRPKARQTRTGLCQRGIRRSSTI